MSGFGDGLDATGRASIFDAFERAAARVGLAAFVVHVDATPPTVIYASEALTTFVGRPPRELVGRPPWELVAAEQRERVRDIIASRGPGAPPITLEFETELPDGTRRAIEVGVARITTEQAELAVCYFRDVTGERAATVALRRSESRFRSLIENAPDGVVIVQDGRIALANPVAVRMFGATELASVRGRLLSDYLPPDDAARAAERIARLREGKELGPSEYRVISPQERYVEVHAIPTEHDGRPAILAFVRDVTERRKLQRDLLRADRLAAIGTMAATVAHEINNPLTYLQLSLQRLEREIGAEPDPARAAMLREHVANAFHGATRVARIVRDLRTHARDDVAEPTGRVDVVAVTERALEMVEHDLRHRARLVRRYPGEPAIVEAVSGRLEQVLINVLVNAIQSLDGTDPAEEEITVTIEVDREVRITVTDTGRGIADPERVFEPFFTTKPIGEGTGLGLSVCKQIVEQMRGRIELASAVGVGTKILIVLSRAAPSARAPVVGPEPSVGERLRVLLVDDEPLVRTTTQMLLADYHDVEVADGAESALSLLRGASFDVIPCDLMMPGTTGRELYSRICAQYPGVERRIVFVTGGAFVPALAEFLESIDNPKLFKPYTSEQALEAISEGARRSRLDTSE